MRSSRFGQSPLCQIAAAALAAAVHLGAARAGAADIDTVEQRIVDNLLSSVPSASTVNGHVSRMASNGSWSDIDYNSTASVGWAPADHLDRLTEMSEAYSSRSSSLYQNANLKASILKAYNYWVSKDPRSSNWYYNEIDTPQRLGNAMVLIKDLLSNSQKSSGLSILARSYEPRSNDGGTNTGQNRVDRAVAGIRRGVVANSNGVVADAFGAVGDAIAIKTGDGIQRDGSFHQHGAQLYNQGYGSAFLADTLQVAALGNDTSFGFSAATTKTLVDFVLDGTQWMVRGQVIDYTASGRSITRKGQSTSAEGLSGQLRTAIAVASGYRTDELTAFRARMLAANDTGAADPSLSLNGHRHFWRSDFSVTQRPAFYSSIKLSSTRTDQPEMGNDEGIKSLYLGDGVNLLMRSGNEYDNIMPVWNWRRLPGTTVEQDTRSLRPAGEFGVRGTSTFAGGVSDGKYGATAFRYDRYNVAAKKSWFSFDKEVVALGAAINASDADRDVNTTLNQTLLKGSVSYKTTAGTAVRTLALGNSVEPDNLKWVHHDGVGYFFPSPVDNATIRAATQTGSWESINARYNDTPVSRDVFTLYLNHGSRLTGGSYNYIVVPGLTVGQMDGYIADNPIEILRNSSSVQAVRQQTLGVTQAAFYTAGSLNLGGGESFSVSDPSAVMMQRPLNALQFTASSPEAKSPSLAIQLTEIKFGKTGSSWLDGLSKSAEVVLGLPEGTRAGDSVGIAISTDAAAKPTIRFTTFDQPTTFEYTSDASLTLPANTTFNAGSNKTLTFKGAISGNASLTKTGASDLVLAGQNSYSGGTIVLDGSVSVSGDQRSAVGGWLIGPENDNATTVTFREGSKLRVAAGNQVRIGHTTASGEAPQLLNALGSVSNSGSLYVGRNAKMRVTGDWAQTGDMAIVGRGDVKWSPVLTVDAGGAMVYSGGNDIKIDPAPTSSADASLVIGSSRGPGTFTTNKGFERVTATGEGTSIITLSHESVLRLSANVPQLTRGTFQFSLGDQGAIVDTNGFSTHLATPLSNVSGSEGGLIKRGKGTLELSGAGTYRGTTTVEAGTLRVNNSKGSATGTGAVTVAPGATIGGNGRIAGSLSLKSGSTLSPGDSIGTLTTANQTWAGGSHYLFELASVDTSRTAQDSKRGMPGGADWANLEGSLTITATSTSPFIIDIQGLTTTGTPGSVSTWDGTISYAWTLATARDGISGFSANRFLIDTSGSASINAAPGTWSVSQLGNNLMLNYAGASDVPEPAAMAPLCMSLVMLARRRRGG